LAEEHQIDLLLIAGDLFAGDWEDGQREQARQIIPVLKGVAAMCFYIMGNDDNIALDYEVEQIRPLHGRRLSLGCACQNTGNKTEHIIIAVETLRSTRTGPLWTFIEDSPHQQMALDLMLVRLRDPDLIPDYNLAPQSDWNESAPR
jgi:predicted MPP superfamily phosphohydrolase